MKYALVPSSVRGDSVYLLTSKMANGGLLYHSSDVSKILSVAESLCRQWLHLEIGSKMTKSQIKNNIMNHLQDKPLYFSLLLHDIEL